MNEPANHTFISFAGIKDLLFSLIFPVSFFLLLNDNSRNKLVKDFEMKTDMGSNEKLLYPALVSKFYILNNNNLFWMLPGKQYELLRQQLINSTDTAFYLGLTREKYHSVELKSLPSSKMTDSLTLLKADQFYTDAAIALLKDVYHGYKMQPWVGYDQLSGKYADTDNEYLLHALLNQQTSDQFKLLIDLLEPQHKEYAALKQELRKQKEKKAEDTVTFLKTSMNYYRWIHHFSFDRFIVINLPAARLQYYEKDSVVINMKTVVGKPSTPTPRFATVCDQIILYPYWYVPRSITFNEYLPKIKNNPGWLDAHNMQVIDGSGKILNHHKLNWSSFHSGYFPYIIRQSTGCDNALGVIKFNIVTPYGVYLHDTNNKTAFLSGLRYYSHGCMRLEEPLELGNRLLAGKLDTTFLQSCFKEQKPVPVLLEKPVPVFVVYMLAETDAKEKVRYYKDVYKLMNR
jgi:L,D-transpeptidase YcbB